MVMRSLEEVHQRSESLTIATAAIYSQRHIHFLVKPLVNKLQLMDAVDFCENEFKSGRFTPQGINSLMIHEEFRRKSYEVQFTGPMSFISPRLRWLRQVLIWLMMFKSLTGFVVYSAKSSYENGSRMIFHGLNMHAMQINGTSFVHSLTPSYLWQHPIP